MASNGPLIPETVFHQTEQRLYIISLFVLLQAWKLYDLILSSSSLSSLKHSILDVVFLLGLPYLRIPKLEYDQKTKYSAAAVVCFLNWLAFGGWRLIPFSSLIPTSLTTALTYYPTLSSTHARIRDVIQPNSHLKGEFTLHITPYSTARIAQPLSSHPLPCISSSINKAVNVPLSFKTTQPSLIEYTLTLPGSNEVVWRNVSASELERVKVSSRHLLKPNHHASSTPADEEDEEDEEAEVQHLLELAKQRKRIEQLQSSSGELINTAVGSDNLLTLLLPVKQPSTVRLSRVWSAGGAEFRVSTGELKIWSCPEARIAKPSGEEGQAIRCVGETGGLDLVVKGSGGGIKVGWTSIDGQGVREEGFLEGIGDESAVEELLDGHSELPVIRTTSAPPLPRSYTASLPVSFSSPGRKTYTITSVTTPHTPLLALPFIQGETTFSYNVLPSPSISFAPSEPSTFRLLQPSHVTSKYKRPHLTLVAATAPEKGHPFRVQLVFKPSPVNAAGAAKGWAKDLEMDQKVLRYEIQEEGSYSIGGVWGGRCTGEVKEPSEVKAETVEIPEVDMDIKRLQDDCAGELGFLSSLSFRGTPPFSLVYSVQHDNNSPQILTETSQTLQHEFTRTPENEGKYTYRWLRVHDRNYPDGRGGDIDMEDVVQVVHPLAKAEIVGAKKRRVLWECQGNQVPIEVAIKGKAPFSLTVLVSSSRSRNTINVDNLSASREKITVNIPEERLESGGNFTISLGEITDGNGCKRRLTEPAMDVEVRKGRPSARIYAKEGKRSVVVPKGRKVSIPLRLTGEAPWKVQYVNSNKPKSIQSLELKSANSEMHVDLAGVYRLLEVQDRHCTGTILADESSFTIEHIPEPSLALSIDAGKLSKQALVRDPICVGLSDQVGLKMEGQAPFKIEYTVSSTHQDSHFRLHQRGSLGSVSSTTSFPLQTADSGHYTYEFLRIGDANYSPLTSGVTSLASSGRLLLEQEVFGRPSASFESNPTISLCSHGRLTPKSSKHQGNVILRGKAPFELEVAIRSPGSYAPTVRKVAIQSSRWSLDLPDYEFDHVGLYSIAIVSVKDATGCEQEVREPVGQGQHQQPQLNSILVEVAETASVIPLLRVEDVCVGSELSFLLQGSPPWQLEYEWNGKVQHIKTRSSKFSRLADKPGTFAITSISHAKNQCKVEVNDIVRRIHALPSATISEGKTFVETVEEGEQAEIVFSFEGQPPFAFTYTRSEESHLGRPGKILETHTVTHIMEKTYSIYAATEGTWKVSSVEDRFCRYPPLPGLVGLTDKPLLLSNVDLFPPISPP